MIGTKWLSEAIDIDTIKKGVLNIVKAPTGCGKTYWAINEYTKNISNKDKMLYLVDTENLKYSLLKRQDTERCTLEQIEIAEGKILNWEGKRVLVMTYYQFSYVVRKHEKFCNYFETIICDEIHNLIEFNADEYPNPYEVAQDNLECIIKDGNIEVIGMSATPDKAIDFMQDFGINLVRLDEDVFQYETYKTIPYTNRIHILSSINDSDIGIIYTTHVQDMIKIKNKLEEKGKKAVCIWSTRHQKNPMNDKQLAARQYIIDNEELPPQYQVVIINASCGTGINIRGKVDYMIIHHTNANTQIQARGRYRGDLDTRYLYRQRKASEFIEVPEEFLNTELSVKDKNHLCNYLGIRNSSGNLVGWTTVKKTLNESGCYVAEDKRTAKRRYSIITRNDQS